MLNIDITVSFIIRDLSCANNALSGCNSVSAVARRMIVLMNGRGSGQRKVAVRRLFASLFKISCYRFGSSVNSVTSSGYFLLQVLEMCSACGGTSVNSKYRVREVL